MPTRLPRLSLAPVLVAVALGVTACGSSSSSTTSSSTTTSATVIGTSTSVVVSPATTKLLKEHDITVSAVAPAKVSTVILLPTTSGHFVVSSATGRVEDTGGIELSHAGTSIQLTGFVVDTESKQVTAAVGGLRAPVFDLTLSSIAHRTGPSGTAVFGGIKLTLTEEAATTLNSDLAVNDLFKAGQEFGVATQTIAVS